MASDTKSLLKARPSIFGPSSKLKIDSSSKPRIDSSSSSKPRTDSSSSVKSRIDSSSVIKKKIVETSIKTSAHDSKNRSNTNVTTSKMVKKTSEQSNATGKKVSKPREKKVYTLAGQKFDVPEEREPLRIFYESLSQQIPSSEMAEFWLMEHGLLSPDKSKKAFEKKQRKQKQIRMGTPIKPLPPYVSSSNKPESSKRPQQQAPKNGNDVKAKKRIMNDSDEDSDDFVLSHKRKKG